MWKKLPPSAKKIALSGSLPLAWEKAIKRYSGDFFIGITPTCVGKRRPAFTGKSDKRDHSHVCGKKSTPLVQSRPGTGTLPRVWEKVYLIVLHFRNNRYTPTCVGKRVCDMLMRGDYQVHSHVCGKKRDVLFCYCKIQGTLPRVWEKVSFLHLDWL